MFWMFSLFFLMLPSAIDRLPALRYCFDRLNARICHFCALHSMRKVPKCKPFGASIASDSTPCSSSFCTFSLSTRHFSWWISCVCQHLKIVWESSKSDPASLSNLTRHAFALALTQKMKKCEYCQSENAPKVSQKFACQPFFLQMARAEIRTDHAGQKYTFT